MNHIRNNMGVSKKLLIVFTLLLISYKSKCQELINLLEQETSKEKPTQKVVETFYGTRVINSQSVETVGKNVLQFAISHRFGTLNEGAYNFYGLDFATIRLGFDYGIRKWWNIGVGRSSFNKTYDGYTKFRILAQTEKGGNIPVTIDYFASAAIATIEKSTPAKEISLNSRLAYVNQILIARKFANGISLQLMPTWVHRNAVSNSSGPNNIFSIGGAARFKFSKRFALVGEYFYKFTERSGYYNAIAVGLDIETGGHVFQLLLTNSIGMIESQFIPLTIDNWRKGGIHFGFNLSRVFSLSKKKEKKTSEQ